jgi:probable rRNA maturation factor
MLREPRETARMKEPDRDIVLQNPNRYPDVRARRLRPWLERLLEELAPAARSLGVRFCGDREMRRTNRRYRGLDKTTDVLSFPGEVSKEGEDHLGDVLISVPVARRQAAEAHHEPEREIKTLLLHGVLHCLGYDHETDQGQMERLERRLRKTWIPVPPDDGSGDDEEDGHGHA